MDEITNFDVLLETIEAQAKRGVLIGFVRIAVLLIVLWAAIGTGALYFCCAAAVLAALPVLCDIADGYRELSRGFDFDYSVKTN